MTTFVVVELWSFEVAYKSCAKGVSREATMDISQLRSGWWLYDQTIS